ncbi:MAG TPA: PepSY domain-containing protein [Actinomycetaceae bacterium]|nr:PepSY domain-containing protein [Actinomycetaceae bacterium]
MKRTTRYTVFAAGLAAVLGLAACGQADDGDATATPTRPAAETQGPTDAATTPSDDGGTTAAPGATGGTSAHEQEVIANIDAAEAAVPGTSAIEYDLDESGSIDIDVTDGRIVTEVEIRDGVATIRGTDDLDDDDRAEFEAATVTMQEAVSIALAEWPGIVDDIELDDNDDSADVRWEFDIIQDGREIEIFVDARTGATGLDD